VGALSLQFDPFETCPLRFDPFEALSMRFDPFETCLLRFDPFETCPLRLDPFEVLSLRLDPFEELSLRFDRRLCGLTLHFCRSETSPLWFGDLADSMSLRFAWHYGLILQICHPETSPLQFNLADSISLWCNYDLHFECLCVLPGIMA
jgi:hypothetical protein